MAGIIAALGMEHLRLRPSMVSPATLSVRALKGESTANRHTNSADTSSSTVLCTQHMTATEWKVLLQALEIKDRRWWVEPKFHNGKADSNSKETGETEQDTLDEYLLNALNNVREHGCEGVNCSDEEQKTILQDINGTPTTPSISTHTASQLYALGLVQVVLCANCKRCVATEHAEVMHK